MPRKKAMNQVKNKILSKPFLESLFFVQNKWHQHGVLVHTLRVVYYVIKKGHFRFIPAAFLHDVGKPVCAYRKDAEDFEFSEYSFTDHEEISYNIVRNWSFISQYTKNIVRYHYLIRDIRKSKTEDFTRYKQKKLIWDALDVVMHKDLELFLVCDDLAKGKKRR